MPVPIGTFVAALMRVGTSRKAHFILGVLLPVIDRMKSPAIRSLMIAFVPKVMEASFARMTVQDRIAVTQMLTSLVKRLTVSNVVDEPQEEKGFRKKLEELGLMKEDKSPSGQIHGERTLIKVTGKPLSQTIIEERR